MQIEHLAFNLEDPLAAAEWYRAHLGMEIVTIRREAPSGAFLRDSRAMLIEFYFKPDAPLMPLVNLMADTFHLAFATSELDVDRDRLVKAGAVALGTVEITPAGDRLAFVRDPFGLCLQLAQRMPQAVP